MFARFVRARVADADEVRRQLQRWSDELDAGASGWRDATGGVTADGELVAVVCFADVTAARANAARPEQEARWRDVLACLSGEPAVVDTTDVVALDGGAHPDAGFVQMMRSRVADRAVVEEIEESIEQAWRAWRPDMLGAYRLWLPDGRMLAVDYFTSEAEARAGEQSEPPPEIAEAFPRWMAQQSELEWFDLTDPWVLRA